MASKSAVLKDCIICLSGTFPGWTHSQLSRRIKFNGGKAEAKVVEEVTHLVTSEADWEKSGVKVKQARENPTIHCVSLQWLLDSLESGEKVGEADYLMSKPDGAAQSPNVTATDGNTASNTSTANLVRKRTTRKRPSPEQSDHEAEAEQPQRKMRTRKPARKAYTEPGEDDEDIKEDEDDNIALPILPASGKSKGKKPAKNKKATKGKKAIKKEDLEDEAQAAAGATQSPADDLFTSPIKKQKGDAQKVKTEGLVIPIDDGCPLYSTHEVYVDPTETIFDVSLNKTDAGNNNNKFYRIQLLTSKTAVYNPYKTWTRWGRVGEVGQSKLLGNGTIESALREFEKKFKDKSGLAWEDRLQPPKRGKYTFVERSYEPDSSDDEDDCAGTKGAVKGEKMEVEAPKSQLELPVQDLMELIFNQQYMKDVMANMNYDADKLPLGKLSRRTLDQGYQALKGLATFILNPGNPATAASSAGSISDLSNLYYSTIPHNFGRNRPPIIKSEEMLRKEIELLESLSDMRVAEEIMKEAKKSRDDVHRLDRQYNGLGMVEMTPLDPKSEEFRELERYLKGTKGSTHYLNYRVQDIFRIERNGENDRFTSSQFGKFDNTTSDRRLLWHGSRTTNFGGILSQGLRIAPPEAPVSGYMFGKGVYLADMSSKSANYCWHHLSGGIGLLLLCEAELGKPMLELTGADYNAGDRAKAQGSVSTWGKGTIAPLEWKDAGCVNETLKGVLMPDISTKPGNSNVSGAYLQYNEYIAYDIAQIRLRYLFRVAM